MDMNCRKCNEPWDWWHIRDEVLGPDDGDDGLYQSIAKKGGYVIDNHNSTCAPYEITEKHTLACMAWDNPDRESKEGIKKMMEELADWQFAPGPYILQCPACIGKEVEPNPKADVMAAMQDILGDDIDGFMAEMEDFEALFNE